MPHFHQDTNHTFLSIRKNSFFLDWQTQPKNYKTYPHFYLRYKIEDFKELENLNLIGGITYEKEFPQGKYYLRTNPSAGGLYPSEIYLQIRGITGLISGIYHYEPLGGTICLLYEINHDGVEYHLKNNQKQNGILFFISSIYFRSSWKYRNRAIHYILLDAGHTLGAIYATLCVMEKESKIVFDFDKLAFNELFGFRTDEMFLAGLFSSNKTDTQTKEIKEPFPFVCGCDYLETNKFVEDAYKKSAVYPSADLEKIDFFKSIPKDALKKSILDRRSIRAFRQVPMSCDDFNFITEDIFNFAQKENIEIFYTIHNVQDLQKGLYKNGILIQNGDFCTKSKYLSLEQNIGGQSGVTFYFTSNEKIAYQKVTILSGFLAHIIYLRAELCGVGCTGIGAYYDEETKEFLGTQNNILYLLAIGR